MNSVQLLSQAFAKAHAIDAAKILEKLPVEETAQFLTEITPELAANIAKLMAPLTASKCLNGIDASRAATILTKLPLDVIAILLRRIDEPKRLEILQNLSGEVVSRLNLLLKFSANTAGALMDPQVFTLSDDSTVKEALKLILKNPRFVLHHIPVLNRQYKFVGLIKYVRELMLTEPEALISSVMHTDVGYLSPTSSRDAVFAHPGWQVYHELPVIDEKGVFLGVVSYQTILGLENETRVSARPGHIQDAGKALGELYWIGMSAFFKGATSLVNTEKKR